MAQVIFANPASWFSLWVKFMNGMNGMSSHSRSRRYSRTIGAIVGATLFLILTSATRNGSAKASRSTSSKVDLLTWDITFLIRV